jgi:transposase InsO family protein
VLREKWLPLDRHPAAPRTTDSRHSLPVFYNPVKDMELDDPHQVRASGITYIRTDEGCLYLSPMTDLRSRKAAGCHASGTLDAEGALCALKMALANLPGGALPARHSDRGCQYCSLWYVEELDRHGLRMSMTEELHCYENARAERLNGTLKQEYGLGISLRSKKQAIRAADEVVFLYNTKRPH